MSLCLPISCLKFLILVGSIMSIGVSIGLIVTFYTPTRRAPQQIRSMASSASLFIVNNALNLLSSIQILISAFIISFQTIILTVIANKQKAQIVDRSVQQGVNQILIGVYIMAILFLLLGIAGLYGSIKSSKSKAATCLYVIYMIGIMVFTMLFLGATIFFFAGPKAIFGNDCQHGSQAKIIDDLYAFSSNVDTVFCQRQCPCFVDPKSELSQYLTALGNYTIVDKSTSGFSKYQECPSRNTSQIQNQLTLAAIEKLLDCGGWCPSDMRFSRLNDINNCNKMDCFTKRTNCHESFKNFMTEKGQFVGVAFLIATLISVLNILAVCCIFCHPSRTGKSRNFYSRMIDTE